MAMDARERLLEQAGRLLADRGCGAVGVQELCRRAQVNKGSFYHFFPSKVALVVELVRREAQRYRCLFEAVLAGPGRPDEKLVRLIRQVGCRPAGRDVQDGGEQAQPTGSFFGHLAGEAGQADRTIRQAIAEAWEQLAAVLEPTVAEALGTGADARAVRSAAWSVLAYMEGLMLMARTQGRQSVIDELAAAVTRLLGPTGAAPAPPGPNRQSRRRKVRVRLLCPAGPR